MDGDPAAEIACDESGSEGERLVGGNTDVFVHGSVLLDVAAAAGCVARLRALIQSPAIEYKANHLLRRKHRAALAWFLGPGGPVAGRAHVYLVDKPFLAVVRVVESVAGGTARDAAALYRAGPAFGGDRWAAFLTASNDLLRAAGRWPAPDPVAAFAAAVDRLAGADDGLAGAPGGGAASAVVGALRDGRARAARLRAELDRAPAAVPSLDPLVPALARTVAHWGGTGRPVRVVHDEQRILTPDRLALLGTLEGRLAGVRFADSRHEPRVQVADFLAGVARRRGGGAPP